MERAPPQAEPFPYGKPIVPHFSRIARFTFRSVAHPVESCYNVSAALLQSGNRKEVCVMEEILTSFLVSVIASVAGNCVSKWLGRHRKGK